jgi:pyruvate kinase
MLDESCHRQGGGVMIARRDLAAECGLERLVELQETLFQRPLISASPSP